MTGLQIDDTEPGLCQCHRALAEKAHVVRPPVHERIGHRINDGSLFRIWTQDSRNSTHIMVEIVSREGLRAVRHQRGQTAQ